MSAWKLEKEVGKAALPELLRELALALEDPLREGRGQGGFAGLPAGALRLLELKAEAKGAGYVVKLEAKAADPGAGAVKPAKQADDSARARDKYRQLKKALQADYKALGKAAQEGLLPPQDTLESFLGLAEAMGAVEQPASGAGGAELTQGSRAFFEDCQALRRAFAARDAAALLDVLGRLERRKMACHAQFR